MKQSDYLTKHKHEALKNKFITEEMFSFYHKLFLYIEKQEQLIEPVDAPEQFFSDKPPVLKGAQLVKLNSIEESLDSLTEIITESQPGLDLSLYKKHVAEKNKSLSDSLDLLLAGKFEDLQKIADQMKTGLPEHIFIIINLFKPAAKVLRKEYLKTHPTENEQWLENHCPFCGYAPDMAKIVTSKDNIHLVHCGFCETEWQFPRVTCTVCGSKDHETQGYYVHKDFNHYRFDFCDKCHSYIKTIVIPPEKEEESYDLTVENILTPFLDATAMDMGYNRP